MSQRLPRILTVLGGLGLLGSVACFPLPTIVLPGSGPQPTPMINVVPTPRLSGTPAASPSVSSSVFWTEAGASPVTQAIESYPRETVTVKAGIFPAYKVSSGANTFWFCGGICIKGSGADVDFELAKLQ